MRSRTHDVRHGRASDAARRMARAGAVVIATVAMMLGGGAIAHAASGQGLNSTIFYAYANAGEHVVVDFASAEAVTITQPDGTVAQTCGSGACVYSGSAAVDGVWVVDYVRTGDHMTAWSVEVRDAGDTLIDGRVWSDRMSFTNTGAGSRSFSVGYLSEYGVIYEASFAGHRGWGFAIEASNRGIMLADGSCQSAYRSVPMGGYSEPGSGSVPGVAGADYTLDGGCEARGLIRYRVFYESLPAADLPVSTALWGDGRTTGTWVLPAYQSPTIGGLGIARPASGPGGSITGTLTGQSGTIRLLIDVDGNGSAADPIDRVIEAAVTVGAFEIPWDGLDGTGAEVPRTQAVTVTAELAAEAEIHFVETDVEGRVNGIQVTRLNGPGAPDSRVSWDDSWLPGVRASVTAPLSATDTDTSGGGVHAWSYAGNGWGNERYVEDWATVYPSASATVVLAGAAPELPPTGVDGRAAGAALLALLAGTAVAGYAAYARRHDRPRRLREDAI